MDAVREEIEVEQEINTILEGVPTLSPADEEAVAAELEAMAAEMNGAVSNTETTTVQDQLPVAPTTKLPELKVPETQQPAQPETRVAVPG